MKTQWTDKASIQELKYTFGRGGGGERVLSKNESHKRGKIIKIFLGLKEVSLLLVSYKYEQWREDSGEEGESSDEWHTHPFPPKGPHICPNQTSPHLRMSFCELPNTEGEVGRSKPQNWFLKTPRYWGELGKKEMLGEGTGQQAELRCGQHLSSTGWNALARDAVQDHCILEKGTCLP